MRLKDIACGMEHLRVHVSEAVFVAICRDIASQIGDLKLKDAKEVVDFKMSKAGLTFIDGERLVHTTKAKTAPLILLGAEIATKNMENLYQSSIVWDKLPLMCRDYVAEKQKKFDPVPTE